MTKNKAMKKTFDLLSKLNDLLKNLDDYNKIRTLMSFEVTIQEGLKDLAQDENNAKIIKHLRAVNPGLDSFSAMLDQFAKTVADITSNDENSEDDDDDDDEDERECICGHCDN